MRGRLHAAIEPPRRRLPPVAPGTPAAGRGQEADEEPGPGGRAAGGVHGGAVHQPGHRLRRRVMSDGRVSLPAVARSFAALSNGPGLAGAGAWRRRVGPAPVVSWRQRACSISLSTLYSNCCCTPLLLPPPLSACTYFICLQTITKLHACNAGCMLLAPAPRRPCCVHLGLAQRPCRTTRVIIVDASAWARDRVHPWSNRLRMRATKRTAGGLRANWAA